MVLSSLEFHQYDWRIFSASNYSQDGISPHTSGYDRNIKTKMDPIMTPTNSVMHHSAAAHREMSMYIDSIIHLLRKPS